MVGWAEKYSLPVALNGMSLQEFRCQQDDVANDLPAF
jgi:hypothetical protein